MSEDIQTPTVTASNGVDLGHICESLRPLAVLADSLVLDPANARSHSPRNLDVIRGSLAKFGQVKPIVVGVNDVVLAGNGTLLAARALAWKYVAVARVAFGDSTAAAFGIADNRSAELAQWDNDALASLLQSLKSEDELLTATGFNADEIAKLIADQNGEGELPDDASGKEYDESVADDVEKVTCPHCGKEFPA